MARKDDIEAAVMAKLREMGLDRLILESQGKATPSETLPTKGFTIQVEEQRLAKFKDVAIDRRMKFYEAANEAFQMWIEFGPLARIRQDHKSSKG